MRVWYCPRCEKYYNADDFCGKDGHRIVAEESEVAQLNLLLTVLDRLRDLEKGS